MLNNQRVICVFASKKHHWFPLDVPFHSTELKNVGDMSLGLVHGRTILRSVSKKHCLVAEC